MTRARTFGEKETERRGRELAPSAEGLLLVKAIGWLRFMLVMALGLVFARCCSEKVMLASGSLR